MLKLSKVQKEMVDKQCPCCDEGKLSAIVETDTELILWCNSCHCSIDSDGRMMVN